MAGTLYCGGGFLAALVTLWIGLEPGDGGWLAPSISAARAADADTSIPVAGVGLGFLHERGENFRRIAGTEDQSEPVVGEAACQRRQGAFEPPALRVATRSRPFIVVEDEDWIGSVRTTGGICECGLIVEPQVAVEPDDGRGCRFDQDELRR